jgi:flagellar assembly protein FliH
MSWSDAFAPVRAAQFVELPLAESRRFEPAAPGAAAAPAGAAAEPHAPAVDLEELRRAAFEEGRAAGRAELPWQDADALRAALGSLEEAARALDATRRGYLRAQRRALVELAIAVAERVLARAVAADPDALVLLVARALDLLGEEEPLRVRLCAAHVETCAQGLAPELARLVEERGVALEPDRELSPGDVRVQAGRCQVDARLGECLRRVREDLGELIEREEREA